MKTRYEFDMIIKDTTKKRSSSDNFRRYANGALAGYYEINTNIAESVKARWDTRIQETSGFQGKAASYE